MKTDVSNLYRSQEYGEGNNSTITALVAGFDGKITDLEPAAMGLVRAGSDVISYAYDTDILLAGDGKLLPQLAGSMLHNFINRTADYTFRRYGGVSLGGGIAANMQKGDDDAQPGLYAATGIEIASLIKKNPAFRAMVWLCHKQTDIHKVYKSYTLRELQTELHSFQEPPTSPFTIALGGLDFIVRQREMLPKLAAWRKNNNIRYISLPWLAHNGTIKWFNNNSGSMLRQSEALEPVRPARVLQPVQAETSLRIL